MNKRQKLIQQQYLNNEQAVIKRLNSVYNKSLTDITDKIKNLEFTIGKLQQEYDWLDPNDPERAKVKSMIQSKIYQKSYQEQLQKQVDGILNQMQTSQFTTVSGYLDTCYTDGFIGSIFDAHGQGVPFVTPIDQQSMVRAVQLDSKISKGLYTRLGEDVNLLKKKITAQVSRGISTGMSYKDVAKQLENYTRIGYNNAIRIARTEGHRIQTTATMDAMTAAKDMGADVVKQWDSTLDGATRESHVAVDGEIRELDKPFSNGLDYPGDPSGKAAEVINCRCALLQRAKWTLADDKFTKFNNFTKQVEEFDSPEDYGEFKKAFFSKENMQYMNYVEQMQIKYGTRDFPIVLNRMTDIEYGRYTTLLRNNPIYNKGAKVAVDDVVEKTVFTPAQTIEEAREHLKTLGLSTTLEYSSVNLDVANMMGKEIQAVYDTFGNLNQSGYLKAIRILTGKKSFVAAYSKPFREVMMVKTNVCYKNSMARLLKEAKTQHDFGFWSTADAEHSVRHELGHAIQHMLTDNDAVKLNKISVLRNKMMQDCGITTWSIDDTDEHMKSAGNVLSYYALRNDGEMIAESVAEYMSGNPRDMAKQVIDILLN